MDSAETRFAGALLTPLHALETLGVAALASVLLSHPRVNGSTPAFLRNATVGQAILVFGVGALHFARGQRSFLFTSYGLFFEFFGLAAIAGLAGKG